MQLFRSRFVGIFFFFLFLFLICFFLTQTEVIPNDVTEFFLRRSGFECEDPVVIKMVSFAAQKFLSDLAKESYALSKKRQQVAPGETRERKGRILSLLFFFFFFFFSKNFFCSATQQQQQSKSRRNIMLLEDVTAAAAKYGIRVAKPEYFADSVNAGLVVEQSVPDQKVSEKRGAAGAAVGANPPVRKKKKN